MDWRVGRITLAGKGVRANLEELRRLAIWYGRTLEVVDAAEKAQEVES